jgi:hypothetical protein
MSSYDFRVLNITAARYAASPQLTARLAIDVGAEHRVHAIALHCQVRIEPQRRAYSTVDEGGLRALFGERERWPETLKPFQWMQCSTTVQGFTGTTEVDLPLPCTYDFEVAGSRYLTAVRDGTIPLSLMFSGTVFTRGEKGFGVENVPWNCEARHDMPVQVWHDMIDVFFPHSGWIRLDRDVLDLLADYRGRHGLISWDETMTRLMAPLEDGVGR